MKTLRQSITSFLIFTVIFMCFSLLYHSALASSARDLSPSLFEIVNQTPPQTPINGELRIMNRYDILNDPADRISKEFTISKSFLPRVQFWLDIYTKYTAREYVIHHAKYPWIVFDVVDLNPLELEPMHKWTRYHRGQALVKKRTAAVHAALNRLIKLNSFNGSKLNELERSILVGLSDISGSRKKVLIEARDNLRTQLGQRDFFISGLRNSAPYLAYMEAEMQQVGLPPELARTPLVESSFNQHAQSKVGASGVWQIMPRVGREYLIVGDHIDERLSPLKATIVARELFRRNYRALKSWPLAVTAYNHGAYSLKKSLTQTKTTDLEGLIKKSPYGAFRFASANFYACFLAAVYAERYQQEIFLDAVDINKNELRYKMIVTSRPLRAKNLEKYANTNSDQLLNMNPDIIRAYKNNAVIPRGFKLFVPTANSATVVDI
jgi:membrane-bound lytic murein transglycosylase D